MFELLEAAANFAGMLVSMDCALFRFNHHHSDTDLRALQHHTPNLYTGIRWGGFSLETMPKWEDTPLGSLDSEYVL